MDNNVIVIALLIINIICSGVSPMIIAVAYFINRIRESDCCGSRISLSSPTQKIPINYPKNNYGTNENENENDYEDK